MLTGYRTEEGLWRIPLKKMSKISTPIHFWFNYLRPKNPSPMYFNFHPLRRRLHIIMWPQDSPLKKHGPMPFEQEIMIPGQVSTSKPSTNTSPKVMRNKKGMESQYQGLWYTNPKESKPAPRPQKSNTKCLSKLYTQKKKCTHIKQANLRTCQARVWCTSWLCTTPM